jgi:methylenetetrahydrofolate reductase (NADPH)
MTQAVLPGPIARAAAALRPKAQVSFEFFPPKTTEMEEVLWSSVRRLEPLGPSFVSVTYGAGGSTRDRTHRTVKRIVDETRLKPAAHLTCVSAARAEVDQVIRDYWDAGVRHIVALRGDPPEGIGHAYTPHPDGYANAAELTEGIRRIADFEVSVGCYPEKHPESPSFEADIDLLKRKIDNGATRAITQFFFDLGNFYRFIDRVRAAGVAIPIVPGVMLQPNFKGLASMARKCGAVTPQWLSDLFEGCDDDPETRRLLTVAVAAELCAALQQQGFDSFHFYTLNRSDMAVAICRILGLKPAGEAAHV